MWLKVAARAKNFRRAGRTLSQRATCGVAVLCIVVSASICACNLAGKTFYTTVLSALIYIIIIPVYLISASKLESALGTTGKTAKTGQIIAVLSRRIAVSLLFGVLSMGIYSVCGSLWSVDNASTIVAFLPTIVVVGINVRLRLGS